MRSSKTDFTLTVGFLVAIVLALVDSRSWGVVPPDCDNECRERWVYLQTTKVLNSCYFFQNYECGLCKQGWCWPDEDDDITNTKCSDEWSMEQYRQVLSAEACYEWCPVPPPKVGEAEMKEGLELDPKAWVKLGKIYSCRK